MPSTDADHGLLDPLWAGRPVASSSSDAAVLAGIVRFEVALAAVTAPSGVASRVAAAGDELDAAAIAVEARAGGNPVIPVLAVLKSRLSADDAAWLHRGATSQDALDTALVLVARDAAQLVIADATAAARGLTDRAEQFADLVITGRTLTQAATPTTLGLKCATWAWGLARAVSELQRAVDALPLQLGGAAGTLAAFSALGVDGRRVSSDLATELKLANPPAPWHVMRHPVTHLGDGLVGVCDALGTVGANVAALSRLGEVRSDGSKGGSSTMPQKSNPVRTVLINSAATRAPFLGATLHAAWATTVDERPDGAWHAEWSPLRELLRVAGGAAALGHELAEDLLPDTAVIAAHVAAASDDLLAERARFLSDPAEPADYLGSARELTADLIATTRSLLEGS